MSDTHTILISLAIMAGLLLSAGVLSPILWIRTGCRLIAFGEASTRLRREAWQLWREVTREFRVRTEELRREYHVGDSQTVEREA